MADVVNRALEQDRDVSLAMGDRGIHLEIDGQALTEGTAGLPLESFEYPLWDGRGFSVSSDALALADDILFSGEEPRCPRCYGPRAYYPVNTDRGEPHRVAYCYRCERSEFVGDT